ncbi:MAG: hypothetical protein M1824_004674 [Vezdaea acicularis]|nr:MAG: hypothetical protein M1824_004674 [Vezdaea acicularis]
MLTSSPSHSPTIHSTPSSPANSFIARSYSNGSYRQTTSQSPRQTSLRHLRPATSPLASTSSLSLLAISGPPPRPATYVDASTQWTPPSDELHASRRDTEQDIQEGIPEPATTETVKGKPAGKAVSHPTTQTGMGDVDNPPSPNIQSQAPSKQAKTPSSDPKSLIPLAVTSNTSPKRPQAEISGVSAAKRPRPPRPAAKVMPMAYETCDVRDLVVLISNMLMELVRLNDDIPLKDGGLTRFHSRAPPGISVLDYLQRLTTHATLSPPILLSMVYYIDRLCSLYPAFTISSLTVHRFLITSATVASKGLSDSFWTNSTYARVGGISLKELARLELEFLEKVDWMIVPQPEVLVSYYQSLVERCEGFVMDGKDKGKAKEKERERGKTSVDKKESSTA